MPRLPAVALLLALSPVAYGQGFTPDEAVKRMTLADGFGVTAVAHEPTIRQPLSISFDSRGRLWVLQYLQYPNYAGLKPVKQDQYLRTVWDKQPEPPPRGPKGADRLTVLSDQDEKGVYRKSKDFVTGLNIASGFCLGDGGVYVAQPPYLLFYRDKDEDDVPDGDPEVLLTGFGMNDTHSLANSLQWGPDGWLYGAAGSTSTSRIKNPADAKAPPVEFQQGIWRYHPPTKRFEMFSEGGGNTYGLDFDKHGQAIAGTNWGGFACLHQFPGAYYVKGFSKHGPLHNPHTYGYFDHVPYTNFKGGHVTCGGVIYEADAYPPTFRGKYVAGNLLSNAVYWHTLEPAGASFKGRHGGDLLDARDTWFRPLDLQVGPDGCVYVADWYDRRAAHLDPVDNWDRTNGRVYRISYKGTPPAAPFDLRKKSSVELVELLKHPNKWWRGEARRLLTERRDRSADAALKRLLKNADEVTVLEALWALWGSGGWYEELSRTLERHPSPHVRAWAIRLATDTPPRTTRGWFVLAARDPSPVVLAQLACSARRMHVDDAREVVRELTSNLAADADPALPLLIWWAIEDHLTRSGGRETGWLPLNQGVTSLDRFLAERYARRLLAADAAAGLPALAKLLDALPDAERPAALKGIAAALQSEPRTAIPAELLDPLEGYWLAHPDDPLITEVMARMGVPAARMSLRTIAADPKAAEPARLKAVDLLRQLRDPKAAALFRELLPAAGSDALRIGLLAGLEAFDDPAAGRWVLGQYPGWSPSVKARAVQFLLARPAWAAELFRDAEAGTFPKAALTPDHARAAIGLGDPAVTALVEKQFGKVAPATAGEKQARIAALNSSLGNLKGDPARGKPLFAKHCGACHKLHGEGGAVGPDLTTADRKSRGYLLTHVVDPSGAIRPEFVVQAVTTTDGRKLSGLVTEAGGASVTLVNVVNDQPVKTVIPKADIESSLPSAVSLMPEKLLDTLTDAEVADLFAYLGSDPPGRAGLRPATPERAGGPRAQEKKPVLTVCLVSGSFEYKSDASFDRLQKEFERYGVRCTRATAATETEIAGLDHLATADAAVFFTRRLRLPPAELAKVKKFVESGKPILGVRTASHGFQDWLEMDKVVFGGNYKGHYGAQTGYELTVPDGTKDHPILKGVGAFKGAGSLYKNPGVGDGVTVLLRGSITDHAEPVAWAREWDGRRAVYTSLGHQDDFTNPEFVRLLVNALAWATKTELKK